MGFPLCARLCKMCRCFNAHHLSWRFDRLMINVRRLKVSSQPVIKGVCGAARLPSSSASISSFHVLQQHPSVMAPCCWAPQSCQSTHRPCVAWNQERGLALWSTSALRFCLSSAAQSKGGVIAWSQWLGRPQCERRYECAAVSPSKMEELKGRKEDRFAGFRGKSSLFQLVLAPQLFLHFCPSALFCP